MAPFTLEPGQRRMLGWGLVAIVLLSVAAFAVLALGRVTSAIADVGKPAPPQITQDVVIARIREVARLVSSEMTLRDVVSYRQTRYGSTKQTLLVVTARISAGLDLDKGTQVDIDSVARRITVTVPPAELLSMDIVSVRTYDERAGLLNPFRPSDRDAIQRRVRAQLITTANQSGLLEHADRSAATILRELLAREGYTVEIRRSPLLD